jgi:large subunit ribosomal protein L4
MANITVKTAAGKDAGSIELADAVFGVQPNVPLMHQVVTAQLAARRSGTQSTKTRAEVRGGGRKPFKQKGTGNARQGSIRSPHYSGGGVALGPKPRKYDQKTPKKMIKAALASALSDRAAEGKVLVIDDWGFDAPKTKQAIAALGALGIDGRALVVVEPSDTNTIKSFLNLPEVQLIERSELNAYDVLCNDVIVFTRATLPGLSGADQVAAKPAQHTPARQTLLAADEPKDVTVEDAPVERADADETADVPAGAAAPTEDGSAPEGFEIKGNADSMLYHVPGSRFYDQTVAEVWFATADDAEAAGYQLPPSQRDDDEEDSK